MKEEELVKGLREGKELAFRELYVDHFNMIRFYVLKNSGMETDAEDLFQEGLIVLVEKLRSADFKLTASIKTFLYSICRNIWLKKLRKLGRMPVMDCEQPIEIADDEEEDLSESHLQVIGACLRRIGDACRSLLEGYYYMKKSMEVLAQDLGLQNANTAKTRKYKCMQRLKKMAHEEMKGRVD